MNEKIFGEIQKTEELNELANNLRKTKEFDEIRLLCKENGISEEDAEKFIKGEQLFLAKKGYLEKCKALQADESVKEEKIQEYTIEDVRKKLEAELQIYRDGDSKYVVEKLIECCETDKELLTAIMLPHKSYDKAFEYFYKCSRNVGYQMPHGNMVYLDNDKAVELSIAYFKQDDKAEEEQNAKEACEHKKKQKETEQKKKTKSIKKSVRKDSDNNTLKKEPVKKVETSKKKTKEIEGQIDLFSIMGI